MTIRLMVLGILASTNQTHGYDILQKLNSWRAETWTSVKPGSIYHALAFLEKHEMATNMGYRSGGGPSMTAYQITAKGHLEFKKLLKEALLSYDQEEFAAGLTWMHALPRSVVLGLVKQRLESYKQTCAFMHELPQEPQPTTPDRHPEIIGSCTVLFEATTAWLEEFIKRLENGAYTFLEE